MEQWNHIVQAALLGTDKKMPGTADFEGQLAEAIATVQQNGLLEKEEQFLQMAAIAFNYKQAGATAFKVNSGIGIAADESQAYCNALSKLVLKDILLEESIPLLEFWLKLCEAKQQLLPPEMLPTVLDKAVQHKQLRTLAEGCIGNRGKWLCQFNSNWSFSVSASPEELWQTGTLEQRKAVLQQLRTEDAGEGRELLQQTWQQENAASKQDLLEVLETGLNQDDIPWLESLGTEKSQKVRGGAQRLLKLLPGSSVTERYAALLQQGISIRKEKTFLGLSSKQTLQIALPTPIDEAIFQSGIEKLSNTKAFSDDEFIVYQLLQQVPPTLLEQHLQLSPEELISFLQKDEAAKKFLPAIVGALVKFRDTRWAIAMMQYSSIFYLDILPLIPLQQQEYYCRKFFIGNEDTIIQHLTSFTKEWSVDLTKMAFTYLAANPYLFPRSFYNRQIHLFPVQASEILEACTPSDEYARNTWMGTKSYIDKLLQLKKQTIQSFQ